MIVIYHSKDLDGFASGAVVKLANPDCTLIGWDYADPIPWDKISTNEKVVMIDISFPIEDMLTLSDISSSLTWIDHHVSARKEWEECQDSRKHEIEYIYQLGVAACELGWNHYFPGTPMPLAIQRLGQYDTWRNQDFKLWNESILPFQFAMRTVCTSPETFPIGLLTNTSTSHNDVMTLTASGRFILEYQRQQDMLACKRASFEREFAGLRAICLNQGAFSSETLKSVYDPNKHDIMVGFQYTGKVWLVSLRSIGEVNVSEIAKSRGGGGHKNAAGFEAKTFEEIFI